MTTIVYDHKNKQIACDSRECAGNEIKCDSIEKFIRVDDKIYFIAGSASDIDEFIGICEGEEIRDDRTYNCAALIVKSDGVYKTSFNEDEGLWELKLAYSDSIGSGGVYALCAVDFGLDAKGAVEYAKTRDTITGGKTYVYDVQSKEFIDEE